MAKRANRDWVGLRYGAETLRRDEADCFAEVMRAVKGVSPRVALAALAEARIVIIAREERERRNT